MDSTLSMASSTALPNSYSSSPKLKNRASINSSKVFYGFQFIASGFSRRICSVSHNGAVSPYACNGSVSSSPGDEHRRRSSLESLFCYDKPIPEERIEKPIGLSLAEKVIGDNPRCIECEAKGAVLCATCSGSGLYVDSILESQGVIVKVRCLGCGGTGNIMCADCGGRGHCGPK